MPLVEFVGQSVQDSGNVAVNPARLINCYREPVVGQGRSQYVLQSVLGQTLLDDLGAVPVRAMGRGNGKNWVAGNSALYELAGAGTVTSRGAIADDSETQIDGNYTDVTVTAGNNYYVWDGSTISQPTTKTFTDVGSHFYVGGYTVLLEDGGKRFQWSALADAGTLDASHFASADKSDDNLLRGFEVQGQALLMCERSAELWAITGDGTTAFSFVTSWNRGLRARNLATKFDDTLFYVGDDNNVYLGIGSGALDITTPAINTALIENTPTHCFYYEDRGHKFCVIRFSDRPAWVFDVKMQEWHERAEGADDGAFRAVASIEGDTWQVGNDDGEIHSLSRVNLDLNQPLRRTAISSPIYLGDRKFIVSKLEISARVGEELIDEAIEYALSAGGVDVLEVDTGFGLLVESLPAGEREGELSLQVSKDGGRTFGAAKSRTLGTQGDYDRRMIWRQMGQAQQFCIKVLVDEPRDFQLNTTAVLEIA